MENVPTMRLTALDSTEGQENAKSVMRDGSLILQEPALFNASGEKCHGSLELGALLSSVLKSK